MFIEIILRIYLWLFQDFEEVGTDFGGGHGCHVAHHYHHATVAHALYLHKPALNAIERAANDAHASTPAKIDLVGTQVNAMFGIGFADGHEAAHLAFGNCDGDIATILGTSEVLDDAYEPLCTAHVGGSGSYKHEVAYGRLQLARLYASATFHDAVAHRDETFHPSLLQLALGSQFAAIGRAQRPPHNVTLPGCRMGIGTAACDFIHTIFASPRNLPATCYDPFIPVDRDTPIRQPRTGNGTVATAFSARILHRIGLELFTSKWGKTCVSLGHKVHAVEDVFVIYSYSWLLAYTIFHCYTSIYSQ